MAVTNFVLMVQGEVHGSFLSGNCAPRKDTIGRGDTVEIRTNSDHVHASDTIAMIQNDSKMKGCCCCCCSREREGGRPGSGRGSKQNKSNIPDKGERRVLSARRETLFLFSFFHSGCDASSEKFKEQRRDDDRDEEDGGAGAPRWKAMGSSNCGRKYPLHFCILCIPISGAKERREGETRRKERKVHLQCRVSKKSFGLSARGL